MTSRLLEECGTAPLGIEYSWHNAVSENNAPIPWIMKSQISVISNGGYIQIKAMFTFFNLHLPDTVRHLCKFILSSKECILEWDGSDVRNTLNSDLLCISVANILVGTF